MAIIRRSNVSELLAAGQHLFTQHHAEVGTGVTATDNAPLNLHSPTWHALEDASSLMILGLFDGDHADAPLLGYAIAFRGVHHFTSRVTATACALFVASEHRRHGWGLRLMNALEDACRVWVYSDFYWHAKDGSLFDRILRGRGARPLETVYVARQRAGS